MQTLELCATQQAGKACADPGCAAFHAQAPAAANAEAAQKATATVCAYHLRGKCSKGAACPAVHAQRAARAPVRAAPAPPGLLPMVAVSPGHPARGKGADKSAPYVLQQNSQTRGKIRQLLASEQRLQQLAATLGGRFVADQRRAAQYIASVEERLEGLNGFIQGLLNSLADDAAVRENDASSDSD